jgi:hypothetical protein
MTIVATICADSTVSRQRKGTTGAGKTGVAAGRSEAGGIRVGILRRVVAPLMAARIMAIMIVTGIPEA